MAKHKSPDEEGMTKREIRVAIAAKTLAVEVLGGPERTAESLNVTRRTVDAWTVLPVRWVKEMEEKTGVARVYLRPDLYKHVVKMELDK
jgi:hypothetical protein